MKKEVKNIFVQGCIAPNFIGQSIAKHSTKKNIGAHSIFMGQVRNDLLNNREVIAINYEAYEEMANEKMLAIREKAFEKFELTCMHVYHSLGRVNSGEICLFVFTSSKHRKNAMAACEFMVDEIKSELPIWGKEIFEGEAFEWKENK